ncbi:endonuclease/exonuclease/phosphatase family protein, partial [Trifolium medium]|nr:endonuclease/exonuclease/phosphatase family protein [Trifolium medium]
MGTYYSKEQWLDRAMANVEWLQMFQEVRLLNLVATKSDHSPIMLNRFKGEKHGRHRRFRFENIWLLEPDIAEVVKEGWQGS